MFSPEYTKKKGSNTPTVRDSNLWRIAAANAPLGIAEPMRNAPNTA